MSFPLHQLDPADANDPNIEEEHCTPADDVDDADDVDGSDEEHCTPDNLSMEDRLTNTIEITKRMSDAVE